MLTYMQIYFLASPDADKREVTTADYYTAVLEPWVKHLLNYKVSIKLNSPVRGLLFTKEGKVIVDLVHAEEEEEGGPYDYVVMAADLSATQAILSQSVVEEDPAEAEEGREGEAHVEVGKEHAFRAALRQYQQSSLDLVTERVGQLPIAPEYKVFRAYFNQQLQGPNGTVDILETP
ncbi:hypothetical protein VYU27_010496, partial [Nannochloropsis oceanica]